MNFAVRDITQVAHVTPVLPDRADATASHHLVTIHGIADTADVWQKAVCELDMSFRSHQQLNLRWHSEVGEPYDFPDPGAFLEAAWWKLPEGPKVVLSHSFGCNALMRMVQTSALDDVEALVFVSPYFKPDYSAFTWPLFTRYVSEFERFLSSSIDVRMQGRPISDEARQTILDRLTKSYSPPSWVMFFMNWVMTPSFSFHNLQMPCFVATGSEDFSILPEDVKSLALRLADSEFKLLDGLGHFSLIEDPKTTATHINHFLNKRLLS